MNFIINITINENFIKRKISKLKERLYTLKIIRRPVPLPNSSIKGELRKYCEAKLKMY